MNNYRKKIIKKIKAGNHISGFGFTVKDYLEKDTSGKTLLEYLIENDVHLDSLEEQKIVHSIEACYIYCKYNKFLYNFNLSEDDLFSEFNGQRFIDFLCDNGYITTKMVMNIKNNIEIIDLIVKSKPHMLFSLNEELIQKLMEEDLNGIFQIEKYIYNKNIYPSLIKMVNEPEKLLKLDKKYEELQILENVNENVLMYQIDPNTTILDMLLKKNIIPEKLRVIPNNIEFVNFLRQKNLYSYLKESGEKVLLLEIAPGKTLLEELIDNFHISKINFTVFDEKTLKILYKKEKLHLVKAIYESILEKNVEEILEIKDKRTLFEWMLDLGYNPLEITREITNEKIIRILYNKGAYKFLGAKVNESCLSSIMDDGKILIDSLLEKNIDIKLVFGFSSLELAEKFYKSNRGDLLAKADIQTLLNPIHEDYTYLDYILEGIKLKKIRYNLSNKSFYRCSCNAVARYYLTFAKYDMMDYINKLTEVDLLTEYNGKLLLNELLDLNSDLTLNKIISKDIKSKTKVAVILKSRGLNQTEFDVPIEESNFSKNYLEKHNNSLGIGPTFEEGEMLLNELYELFLLDGKSDQKLVIALINGYKHSLFVNYELNINELRNLVKIKKNNMSKFLYLKELGSGAYFSSGKVYSDYNIINTLFHETGHALHKYLANNSIPKNYIEVISKVRQNPDTLRQVEKLSIKCTEIRNKLKNIINVKYAAFFDSYFNEERKLDIEQFLNKSKSEKKEEFKSLNLDDDILDIIIDSSFTVEEYINHQKRIFKKEYLEAMYRSKYAEYSAIGDILDAIYEGDLYSEKIKNQEGEIISNISGHGIAYYYATKHGFDEMIANFSVLLKSPNSKEFLDLLKNIVGEEFYNMLSTYYYDNILFSKYGENQNNIKL